MKKLLFFTTSCLVIIMSLSFCLTAYADYGVSGYGGNYTHARLWYRYSYSRGSSVYYKVTRIQTRYYNYNYSRDNTVTMYLGDKYLWYYPTDYSRRGYDYRPNVYFQAYPYRNYKKGKRVRLRAKWDFHHPHSVKYSNTYKTF